MILDNVKNRIATKISIIFFLLIFSCSNLKKNVSETQKSFAMNEEFVLQTPLKLNKGPYFLFDDLIVGEKKGVELKVNPPEKYKENPIVPSGNPSDLNLATGGLTVLPNEDEKGYRMWYMTYKRGDKPHMGYAISDDGIHWELPNLGINNFKGDKNNNIALKDVVKGRIFLDENPVQSDKKYRAIFYRRGPQPVGFSTSCSPDGLHWENSNWIKALDDRKKMGYQGQGASDIVDGFYDLNTGEWISFFKMWSLEGQYSVSVKRGIGPPRYGRRVIGMSKSRDFENWTKAKHILLPDSLDFPTLEFYGLRSVLKRGDWYIGFVSCLIDDAEPDGIGWTELVISRDGRTWNRIRQKFLDRSSENTHSPDHAIAWVTDVLSVEDQEYIYYSGLEYGHKTGDRSGCLAFLKKNRFVAMTPISESGKIETNSIILPENKNASLLLNADALNGEIRVQLSDGETVLKGYSFSDCNPITVDSIAVPVRWRGKSKLPKTERPLKIEFQITNARLFSFEF